MKYVLLLTFAVLLAAGCTTDPGAQLAQHNIRTVGVEKRVNAGAMRYGEVVPGTPNAGLTGLISNAIHSEETKQMVSVMQENGIDVPSIVRTNFVQAVHQIGYQYSEDQADATFVLRLTQYGVGQKLFSKTPHVPFVVIHAELVTTDGKRIWSGNSQDGRDVLWGGYAKSLERKSDEIGVAELEDYASNPEKLRADWEVVVHNAVADLLSAAKKVARAE